MSGLAPAWLAAWCLLAAVPTQTGWFTPSSLSSSRPL